MGGCCSSNEVATETATELANCNLSSSHLPGRSSKVEISVEAARLHQFFDKLKEGYHVIVLLANGNGLECIMRVDPENMKLELSRDDQTRSIPFKSVTRVLYELHDLAKIRTEAKLDSNCAALYMAHDASCIVFCFDSIEERQTFIAASKKFIS